MLFSQYRFNHEYWMHCALQCAQYAWDIGEVPVGAILVYNNRIISEGWNCSIESHDPTAHAEIIALRKGGMILKNYRLLNVTLYTTLEPCVMCFGAILYSRINTLVYGANDEKQGAIKLLTSNVSWYHNISRKTHIVSGILAPACSSLIKDFFRMRRLQKKYN